MKINQTLKKIFKGYMLAGTAVLVPLIATYLILKFIILSADNLVISLLPEGFRPAQVFGKHIPGLGLIATAVLILFAGILTRLYVGRKLVQIGDLLISKIPLGRGIYSGIKQLMGTFLSQNKKRFRGVVAVEFPRKGCQMIGFITADALPCTIQGPAPDDAGRGSTKKVVNVFIPTSPNPTTGFLIMVPEDEVRLLDMEIDEALKLIISGGIVREDDGGAPPTSSLP